MVTYLDFEKPVAELENQIAQLRAKAGEAGAHDLTPDIERLQDKVGRQLHDVYARLSPWQKTQVARHPGRPKFLDIAARLTTDFMPLAGDRSFADDPAIVGGLARLKGRPIMLIGHEKGSDTPSRVKRNFGMAKPEGYRKAVRLMELADRFGLPVVTLVDTPGAFPGVEAEERGQAEAIARATQACLDLSVPFVAMIVGEGGSGGAVALATANRVLMFEHAVYSVISPEGCASILWRTAERAADAAEAMKLTAADLTRLGVVDRVVEEPLGGAHRDPAVAITRAGEAIAAELAALSGRSPQQLRAERRGKFLQMGRAA